MCVCVCVCCLVCVCVCVCVLSPQDQPGVFFMKGAYEQVIRYCSSFNSRGAAVPLSQQQRELFQQQKSYMGTAGLRGTQSFKSGLYSYIKCCT